MDNNTLHHGLSFFPTRLRQFTPPIPVTATLMAMKNAEPNTNILLSNLIIPGVLSPRMANKSLAINTTG